MLEGQWADNLPCRHACTIIFSSYVSTTEVQPRIGLDTDTTLQKLWEDAHVWRHEHKVEHYSPAARALPSSGPAAAKEREGDEDVAPAGAAQVSGATGPASKVGSAARSGPAAGGRGEFVGGANSASVDVGRSAEQSTDMFRSLQSVAVQLHQGLAEMEELHALLDDEGDAPASDTTSMAGPASTEGERVPLLDAPPSMGGAGERLNSGHMARLRAIRSSLAKQVLPTDALSFHILPTDAISFQLTPYPSN
jgi:hypothetical protein